MNLREIKDPEKRARFAAAANYLRTRSQPSAKTHQLPAGNPGPIAQLEPNPRVRPLAAQKVQGPVGERILVRVTSIRRRLLDEDNLCEKFHVDLCRYAGIIPDDAPAQVKIETTQRQCVGGEPERVIIEIV